MKGLPVRLRLTLAFAVVMAVVLAATGVFVYQRQQSSLDQGLARSLEARAADVAALAQQSDSGLRESQRSPALGEPTSVAQLIDARGRVVDATPGVGRRTLIDRATLARARSTATVIQRARVPSLDEPARLLAVPVRAQGQAMVAVVGQSLEDRDRALSDLAGILVLGGPAALLLAALAGYGLTGAALRPVEAMRRRARDLSASDLGARLPSAGGNDELGRLGRTLNEMLARVETAVGRERAFVSDASHELRTPLAMLRTELELIARDKPSGQALQEATASAIEESDRLGRLADDLLLLSRADEGRIVLNRSSLPVAELLAAAAERARRAAPEHAGRIIVDNSNAIRASVDRPRLDQALDNLVVNAIRHGGGEIQLSARRGNRGVELHVTDRGPGFPSDFLPRAFERFARPDAGRTDDGAGLGLALVRTIAELHGGTAHASNRPDGGSDVWIVLPDHDQGANPGANASGIDVTSEQLTARKSGEATVA
jgi:two-component system OmpR family sensor kinase